MARRDRGRWLGAAGLALTILLDRHSRGRSDVLMHALLRARHAQLARAALAPRPGPGSAHVRRGLLVGKRHHIDTNQLRGQMLRDRRAEAIRKVPGLSPQDPDRDTISLAEPVRQRG